MKAKEYLKGLKRLDIIINQKIEELDELYKTISSVSSMTLSSDLVQISSSNDAPFSKKLEKIESLREAINKEIDWFIDKKHIIINQIQALQNPTYIAILYKRYVEFKRLEVVAVEMNYSYQYILELHGHALEEFQKVHNDLLKGE